MNFVPKNMLVLALVAAASAYADEMPVKLTISPEGLRIESSKPTADEVVSNCLQECEAEALAKATASTARATLPDCDEAEMPKEATLDGVFRTEEPVDVAQLQEIFRGQASVEDQTTQSIMNEIGWELENRASADINAENIVPAADVATLPVRQEPFFEKNIRVGKVWDEAFGNIDDVDDVVGNEPFWLKSSPVKPSAHSVETVESFWQEAFDKDKIDAAVGDIAQVSKDQMGGMAAITKATVFGGAKLDQAQNYCKWLPSIDTAKLYDSGWFGLKVAAVTFLAYMGSIKLKAWLTKGVTDAAREASNSGGSSSVNNSTAPASGVQPSAADVPAAQSGPAQTVANYAPTYETTEDGTFFGILFNESEAQPSAPHIAGGAGANPVVNPVEPSASESLVAPGGLDLVQKDFKHNPAPLAVSPKPKADALNVDMLPDSDAPVVQPESELSSFAMTGRSNMFYCR